MTISRERLAEESRRTGFRPEILEKVFHLLTLLQGLARHPFLGDRIALKGGTALNLFHWEMPRLSVDADLNFIGSVSRDEVLAARPTVESAITAVCEREGLRVRRAPSDHAGGKFLLRYASAMGQESNVELDLNFMFRVPLWPVTSMDSRRLGLFRATAIPTMDIHELAAGKLAALLARHASRDLFDAHRVLQMPNLDRGRLRLAFVVYGAMNRRDWRTVAAEDVNFSARELKDALIPVLTAGGPASRSAHEEWARKLVVDCRAGLQAVLPLTERERRFLDRLLDDGIIEPELIADEPDLIERLHRHPGLLWKAANVKRRNG